MKKLIGIVVVVCAVWFIGKSILGDFFDETANPILNSDTRYITCHLCHGDGVCYHCDGDSFRDGRRCSVCNGTGKCTACDGKGTLEVIVINREDYTVCTSCHGSGECGLCDGTGQLEYYFSTLGRAGGDCNLCHGNGKCLGCKGTGIVKVRGF